MAATLTAHQQTVGKIFSNEYVFNIPGYQRPYAWTIEQASDLFDDLASFMKGYSTLVEEMPPYFLGSIVLIKSEDSPPADVVDGQQRLTTLTLLLAAIRASMQDGSADDIEQLLYERGSRILGTQDRFRLTLRERDREFFRKFIQKEGGFDQLLTLDSPGSDSQRNLRDNGRLYAEKLAKLEATARLRLAQFIVTRCYLVAVATPDLDSAYRIFSVLNSRGLDLSATDILKSEIIGATPAGTRDANTQLWEDIEESLGRDSFGDLFSHIRMVYRKAKPQGTLIKEFKDHVLAIVPSASFIDDVLVPMASVYEFIADSSYQSSEKAELVNERLKWLNRLEFNDWVPPSIAFAIRHRDAPEKMARFFADLERLAYCMLITKFGVNERIDRFSRLTVAVESKADLFVDDSPLQLTNLEQERLYRVLSGPIYEILTARARSSVLLRLDSLLSGGGATYDYSTITVEHVLPQNPQATSCWEEWIPEEDQRAAWTHKLGNLALLTRKKNSAASNFDFERKKKAYFSNGGVSPFVLTTQVLQHKEWTTAIMADRQKELLSRLESHWRLENRSNVFDKLLAMA